MTLAQAVAESAESTTDWVHIVLLVGVLVLLVLAVAGRFR